MRSEREKYNGPFANVETYELRQEMLDEPVRKPWYFLPELNNVLSPQTVRARSSGGRLRRRWLTTLNAQAREVVAEAYEYAMQLGAMVSWVPGDSDYLSIGTKTQDTRAYRDWIREKLKTSGIAERLPSGLAEFPDIYAEMPQFWAMIERLRAPRDYRQLVRHMARYLDWYLDPAQPVKLPFSFTEKHLAYGMELSDFRGWRGAINAAELYYYLLEKYSEDYKPRDHAEL